ncbi:hypothetical protein HU200_059806 [Digitaria exilis]|uniref:Protein kinase domain-containing protein n=1 Tax=Digitaria exilis TaxID=1010633 RepID=A0A835AKD6_9POAL|nr:hypothetical protein HU200_059806 [Digitaria exilis]
MVATWRTHFGLVLYHIDSHIGSYRAFGFAHGSSRFRRERRETGSNLKAAEDASPLQSIYTRRQEPPSRPHEDNNFTERHAYAPLAAQLIVSPGAGRLTPAAQAQAPGAAPRRRSSRGPSPAPRPLGPAPSHVADAMRPPCRGLSNRSPARAAHLNTTARKRRRSRSITQSREGIPSEASKWKAARAAPDQLQSSAGSIGADRADQNARFVCFLQRPSRYPPPPLLVVACAILEPVLYHLHSPPASSPLVSFPLSRRSDDVAIVSYLVPASRTANPTTPDHPRRRRSAMLPGGDDHVSSVIVLLLVALWFSPLVPLAAPDLAADRAALLAFRSAVGPRLPWNTSASSSPCAWHGVVCDPTGSRVVSLKLPGSRLVGAVPPGTIGNLTSLRTLSLRLNALSGKIPSDIGSCTELRYLYLHGNRFDGEIPEGFFGLTLLQRLDLSGNRISGAVSPEFNRLPRLATLYLENNSLNGTLPADLDLKNLQQFNVSGNVNLTGPVPSSLAGRPASAFGDTALCGVPLNPCPTPPPSPSPPPSPDAAHDGSKSAKLSTGAIASIAVGAGVAFLVLIAVIFFLCFRCRRTKAAEKSAEMAAADGDSPVMVTVASMGNKSGTKRSLSSSHSHPTAGNSSNNAKRLVFLGSAPETPYDLESLLHSSAEVIGKGWLGTTYRATLEGGSATVAVKRLRSAPIPEREFRDRVTSLAALRHDNLVPLRAYFYSRDEKLLVYDFVGSGSLCSLLHGNSSSNTNAPASPARLDFTSRARIALAAARGVAFIHGAGGARSCHGNIKSSNVLVNDTRNDAYVTDHGLLQLVGAHVPLKRVTGYRAPEVTDTRRASRETDVYSFGVLLLEMLTGKPPVNSVPGSDGVELPRWVRTVVEEEWTAEVFDAGIAIEERVEEEMVRMLQLAVECTDDRPDRRPTMAEVASRIEHIVDSALRKSDTDDDFHSISP